jgi:4-alpha-glucanotransferase
VTRRSGLVAPLFTLVTSESWGIGEFRDLAVFARWALEAGQALVQILPVMELPAGERSPYSALSSFALDPTCIAVPAVPDFEGIGADLAFAREDHDALDRVRRAPRVAYDEVRRLKDRWLRRAFDRFLQLEMARGTPRARRFEAFAAREAWWLDNYADFRALLAHHSNRPWWDWPPPLAHAGSSAVSAMRADLQLEIGYRKYLQWIAGEQWADARRLAWPVRVFGDLPFTISGNSADVWRRQPQFHLDATVGAPPDAFAPDGQDWGLPPWRWRAMRQADFEWMRQRARRHADLFDGFRIDHLVGLYRAWIRPVDTSKPPHFEPATEDRQRWLGEMLVGIFKASGAEVIAEDLGTVPDFVRRSITALGVPGFKVLRWERHWNLPGQPLIDPETFPPLSVATTGTHDIDPLGVELRGPDLDRALARLLAAGSSLALIPVQDVFGWPDRINTPAVVDDRNWTWKVPRPVDWWLDWDEAVARMDTLRDLTRASRR